MWRAKEKKKKEGAPLWKKGARSVKASSVGRFVARKEQRAPSPSAIRSVGFEIPQDVRARASACAPFSNL